MGWLQPSQLGWLINNCTTNITKWCACSKEFCPANLMFFLHNMLLKSIVQNQYKKEIFWTIHFGQKFDSCIHSKYCYKDFLVSPLIVSSLSCARQANSAKMDTLKLINFLAWGANLSVQRKLSRGPERRWQAPSSPSLFFLFLFPAEQPTSNQWKKMLNIYIGRCVM